MAADSGSKKKARRLETAVLLSLLVHTGLVAVLVLLKDKMPRNLSKPDDVITVTLMPPEKSKRIVETKNGFIVDEAPKDAYLSDANRIVREETIAKETQLLDSDARRAQKKKTERAAKAEKSVNILSNFGVSLVPPTRKQAPEDRDNWANMEESGGLRFNDYVRGLKEGQQTALNTKEFVFFGYYQRIRQKLDMAWRPFLRQEISKIFRQGRNLASATDFTTKTMVVLNKHGEIVEVRVLEESGTKNLDEAAVRAFNAAGPFPNPPQGLVDAQGMVEIRWDFVLRT